MPEDQEELMRALHDEHAAALWGYCLHLTDGDHARAQDVCQETLLRAWKHPDVLTKPPSADAGMAVHRGPQHRHRRVALPTDPSGDGHG